MKFLLFCLKKYMKEVNLNVNPDLTSAIDKIHTKIGWFSKLLISQENREIITGTNINKYQRAFLLEHEYHNSVLFRMRINSLFMGNSDQYLAFTDFVTTIQSLKRKGIFYGRNESECELLISFIFEVIDTKPYLLNTVMKILIEFHEAQLLNVDSLFLLQNSEDLMMTEEFILLLRDNHIRYSDFIVKLTSLLNLEVIVRLPRAFVVADIVNMLPDDEEQKHFLIFTLHSLYNGRVTLNKEDIMNLFHYSHIEQLANVLPKMSRLDLNVLFRIMFYHENPNKVYDIINLLIKNKSPNFNTEYLLSVLSSDNECKEAEEYIESSEALLLDNYSDEPPPCIKEDLPPSYEEAISAQSSFRVLKHSSSHNLQEIENILINISPLEKLPLTPLLPDGLGSYYVDSTIEKMAQSKIYLTRAINVAENLRPAKAKERTYSLRNVPFRDVREIPSPTSQRHYTAANNYASFFNDLSSERNNKQQEDCMITESSTKIIDF